MNIQLITKAAYANKYWQPFANFSFTRHERVAPLVLVELAKAQQSLPVAFAQQGDDYQLVALLGLTEGNAFINAQGQWFSGVYIPAVFRSYPFRIAKSEDDQYMLCIDEDSGLVTESVGEAFFDADGQASEKVQSILTMLVQVAQNQSVTQAAITALAKYQLIVSWPLTLQVDEGARSIEGLYRIDEAALANLSSAALSELMQSGALLVAYAQLFSMQNLKTLTQLMQAHLSLTTQQQASLPITQTGELNLDALDFSHFK